MTRRASAPRFGQKPCPKCGEWVSEITLGKDSGRRYNNDGTWHEVRNGTCRPDPAYQEKARLQRAEWEAKNLIREDDRRESRGYTPGYMRRG